MATSFHVSWSVVFKFGMFATGVCAYRDFEPICIYVYLHLIIGDSNSHYALMREYEEHQRRQQRQILVFQDGVRKENS